MDLYDDIDTKPRTSQIDGWSSGIKMLQTQLAVKKAQMPKVKEQIKKPLMTPVANLRAKRTNESDTNTTSVSDVQVTVLPAKPTIITTTPLAPLPLESVKKDDWDFVDEYDPQWPNEYDKLKEKLKNNDKARREERSRRRERERAERDRENERSASGMRNAHNDSPSNKFTGFAQRPNDEDRYSPPPAGVLGSKSGGAAIAPPPSLLEIAIDNGDGASNVTIPYSASSVAAKIMAKYGFKDGQGLGKQEQGMSMALQVEKTSKRGGRIIHEKDVFLPPTSTSSSTRSTTPPPAAAEPTTAAMPPPSISSSANETAGGSGAEPSITEIMKEPSKVVLLRNMVGPGDVDEELEPEVKDECNQKYGEVTSVLIHEAFGTVPEEAVKIFVEFKRIESAIKAVVDLNGRFFGGRQVRAGFYNYDKFKSFQLH